MSLKCEKPGKVWKPDGRYRRTDTYESDVYKIKVFLTFPFAVKAKI